jgi:TRAP transporter TatT component family protein
MIRLLIIIAILTIQACSIGNLPANLSRSMMNQEDPELVRTAAPAYLLMLDALVATYPGDETFLIPAAKLYGAYAGVFSNDEAQTRRMANRAKEYAQRALCENEDDLCEALDLQIQDIVLELDDLDEDELTLVYTYAAAWASWIQANSSDWDAVAQLPKVKILFNWVLRYDPNYDNGTAQVYMGVLESQLPPSLGGRPDLAKMHFENAILASDNKHLMAKVLYAQQYARLLFEQELHDRLLTEVINADPRAEGLTLINQLAKQQAKVLLAESAEYFE